MNSADVGCRASRHGFDVWSGCAEVRWPARPGVVGFTGTDWHTFPVRWSAHPMVPRLVDIDGSQNSECADWDQRRAVTAAIPR